MKRQRPARKDDYSYAVPHQRKCEMCGALFVFTQERRIPSDADWRCPDCRQNPKVATDTVTVGGIAGARQRSGWMKAKIN